MQPRRVDSESPPAPTPSRTAAAALVRRRGEPKVLLDHARGDADDVVSLPVLDEPDVAVGAGFFGGGKRGKEEEKEKEREGEFSVERKKEKNPKKKKKT